MPLVALLLVRPSMPIPSMMKLEMPPQLIMPLEVVKVDAATQLVAGPPIR